MRGFIDLGLESLGRTLSSHWGFQKAARLLAGVPNHWHPTQQCLKVLSSAGFHQHFPSRPSQWVWGDISMCFPRWILLAIFPSLNLSQADADPHPSLSCVLWPSSRLATGEDLWPLQVFPGHEVLSPMDELFWVPGTMVGFSQALNTAQLLFLSVLAISLLSPLVSC